MIHYIETHGFESLFAYLAFAAVVGTMPKLPPDAGFWSRWGYGFLHVFAMNIAYGLKMMKAPVPDIDPNTGQITGTEKRPTE